MTFRPTTNRPGFVPTRFNPLLCWSRLSRSISADKRAGLEGLCWMGAGQFSAMAVRLISSLVLTRLLAPDCFGLLGTAMALITTLEWVSDAGVQPALIRHPRGHERDYLNTGWWIGVLRGTLIALVTAGLAWSAAAFYRNSELAGILMLLALRPFILALRSPAMPVLRRQLNYRFVFIEELSQTVVGTVVSIALAAVLHSPLAIVGGTLTGAAAAVLMSYVLTAQRPGRWHREAAGEIWGLGGNVLVNTLIMACWLNLDRAVGLRLLSPEEMGWYAIASNLAAVLEGISVRGCDVHFSMLSRMSNSLDQVRWHVCVMKRVTSWSMPVLACGVLLAKPAVCLLYDPRYTPAGALFAILIARLMFRALGQFQFQLLLVRAQVHLATRAYVAAFLVQLVILVPLLQAFGVVGLAISALVSTAVATVAQILLSCAELRSSFTTIGATLAWMLSAMFLVCWM